MKAYWGVEVYISKHVHVSDCGPPHLILCQQLRKHHKIQWSKEQSFYALSSKSAWNATWLKSPDSSIYVVYAYRIVRPSLHLFLCPPSAHPSIQGVPCTKDRCNCAAGNQSNIHLCHEMAQQAIWSYVLRYTRNKGKPYYITTYTLRRNALYIYRHPAYKIGRYMSRLTWWDGLSAL
jgi:hypothetical protein